MKKNDKIFTLLILFLAFIVFLFLSGYDRNQDALLQVNEVAAPAAGDNALTDYAFNPIVVSEGLVTVEGWAIARGTDSLDIIPTLFLVDEEGSHYEVTTRVVKRNDVTLSMNDGHNYNNSGFVATFDPESLGRDRTYTLLIHMEMGGILYTTSTDMQVELP